MEEPETAACIHHWVLGEPRRGKVRGTCRRCGMFRTYPSAMDVPDLVADYEELDLSRPLVASEPGVLSEEPSLV